MVRTTSCRRAAPRSPPDPGRAHFSAAHPYTPRYRECLRSLTDPFDAFEPIPSLPTTPGRARPCLPWRTPVGSSNAPSPDALLLDLLGNLGLDLPFQHTVAERRGGSSLARSSSGGIPRSYPTVAPSRFVLTTGGRQKQWVDRGFRPHAASAGPESASPSRQRHLTV
jgi:hypothetical protein